MTTSSRGNALYQIYPKRYFDKSPTWFAWNRLTAADVHALREERGFEGQHVYFHLNHPIQFVRIVGLVVEVELTRGEKHTLISLDDGSGACIQAKVSARDTKPGDHAIYPSNTLVDCVDVRIKEHLATVYVNKEVVGIGSVLKVKARLDSFMNVRQLRPERVWIVKDTNAEAQAWAEAAEWKRNKLATPWVLTKAEMDLVDEEAKRAAVKDRERQVRLHASRAKYEEKKKRHLEKREVRRRRHEEKLNAGALKGSNVVRAPWE